MAQLRTLTVPDGNAGGIAELDPILALRERDTGIVHAIAPERFALTIGAARENDIVLSSPYVSGAHCACERRGALLRVRDRGSHNGTFIDGGRVDDGELRAGGRLLVAGTAGVSLLAMSQSMLDALEPVKAIVGFASHKATDDILAAAIAAGNLAILAETGSDQDVLVDAIHHMSPRRRLRLSKLTELPDDRGAQRELIETIQAGTLALAVSEATRPVDNLARGLLFDPAHQIRIVVSAVAQDDVVRAVGVDAFARMHLIEILPLRRRAAEIHQLIDLVFEQRGSTVRFEHLTHDNQRAMRAHSWPGNVAQLREVVGWVDAIISAGSMRKAVDVLGVKRSTLQGRLSDLGLTLPLIDRRR